MNTNTTAHEAREQRALAIFRRHVAAFTSGDIDAVLNDFDTHSVVITPDGVFEGGRSGSSIVSGWCHGAESLLPTSAQALFSLNADPAGQPPPRQRRWRPPGRWNTAVTRTWRESYWRRVFEFPWMPCSAVTGAGSAGTDQPTRPRYLRPFRALFVSLRESLTQGRARNHETTRR
jgi:hypothetical protein